MSQAAVNLLLTGVLLGLSGMFAASEIGLLTLGRLRARHLADKGSFAGKMAVRLLEHPARLLSTILICITSLLYTAETLVTVTSLEMQWGLWVPMVLMPIIVITLTEVTPVLYASQNAEQVTRVTAPLVRMASIALFPIITVVTGLTNFLVRVAGGMPDRKGFLTTEEEIKTAIVVAEEEGVIEPEERQMLHGAIEFTDKTVREVMVPRVEMVAVRSDTTLANVMTTIVQEKHSRIPVFRDTIDNIIGVVYAKDVLPCLRRGEGDISVEKVCRPPYFIPVTKKVNALLEEFRTNRRLMAIVIGEDGATVGLATVEDLLEEIVGDILDEHDTAEREWEQVGDQVWLVGAHLTVRQANRMLRLHLPATGHQTLAGMVLEHTQTLPSEGQSVIIGNVEITVTRTQGQRIKQVRITRQPRDKDTTTAGTQTH